MSDEVTRYPLSWPTGWKRTPYHQRGPAAFGKRIARESGGYAMKERLSVGDGMNRLGGELRRLGARKVIISSNLRLRLDGLPYADAPKRLDDPGIAVYFTLNNQPRVLACDKWNSAADNLAAIAGHIEAVRAQERYGVGTLDQAFAGYAALPPKADPYQLLGVDRAATVKQINDAHRRLAGEHHPDRGGNHETMARINAARDEALRAAAARGRYGPCARSPAVGGPCAISHRRFARNVTSTSHSYGRSVSRRRLLMPSDDRPLTPQPLSVAMSIEIGVLDQHYGYRVYPANRIEDWCDRARDQEAMIEQFCRDLNQAHDELLRAQQVPEDEWPRYDWPVWTPQANSIRWAERVLGKPLSKRSRWQAHPLPVAASLTPQQEPKAGGCIGCGESAVVGYTLDKKPGPFCRACWDALKSHVALVTVSGFVPDVPIPPAHQAAADRFRRFFKPVPPTDADRLPDPDYGLDAQPAVAASLTPQAEITHEQTTPGAVCPGEKDAHATGRAETDDVAGIGRAGVDQTGGASTEERRAVGMKLRTASESVGWANSAGPLNVSPRPAASLTEPDPQWTAERFADWRRIGAMPMVCESIKFGARTLSESVEMAIDRAYQHGRREQTDAQLAALTALVAQCLNRIRAIRDEAVKPRPASDFNIGWQLGRFIEQLERLEAALAASAPEKEK